MGLVSLTVIVNVVLEGEESVGMNVEKKPPARGWQGFANED
jgi:hypothetical protein